MTESKTAWSKVNHKNEAQISSISEGYLDFLENVKTECEAVDYFVERLKNFRYKNLEELDSVKPGTSFYLVHMGRTLAAGIIGRNGLSNGLYVIASHIDSPRIDLKPRPVYEDSETNTTLLKTQYYGGDTKNQ